MRGKEEAEAKAGSLSVEIAVQKGEAEKAGKAAEEEGRRRREAEQRVEEGEQQAARLKAEIASAKVINFCCAFSFSAGWARALAEGAVFCLVHALSSSWMPVPVCVSYVSNSLFG